MQCVWKIVCALLIIVGLPGYGALTDGALSEDRGSEKLVPLCHRFSHYDFGLIEKILAEQCERAKAGLLQSAVVVVEAIYAERLNSARATAAIYAADKARVASAVSK